MMTIADGGKVTTTGGTPEVPDGIGGGAGSIGNAVVTGAGSQLTVAHNFGVGIVGGEWDTDGREWRRGYCRWHHGRGAWN